MALRKCTSITLEDMPFKVIPFDASVLRNSSKTTDLYKQVDRILYDF